MEWASEQYQKQKNYWLPWIEDMYLKYFTKDNKASYSTKENLDQTKITGNEQVDNVQDGLHGLVAGQLGQGGLAQPIGDLVSKQGINRAEQSGMDEQGKYLPKPEGLK